MYYKKKKFFLLISCSLCVQVRKEDCRLVSYGISRDSRDCSLEHYEDDTMGNVLAYLKSNSCSTDFLLETKHPNLSFPIYRPDDLRIDVSILFSVRLKLFLHYHIVWNDFLLKFFLSLV